MRGSSPKIRACLARIVARELSLSYADRRRGTAPVLRGSSPNAVLLVRGGVCRGCCEAEDQRCVDEACRCSSFHPASSFRPLGSPAAATLPRLTVELI
ncbi:hypothetical protein CLOM_g4765 [Closterium sp. NIES-68]|nr:hypothetical protein CLOM_g4765 [Closterium sp. NIES-68]